ncbi:hypothetical protein L798_00669 [Zootermopsis nevadensis]|uniref:Uncharacterized protein n=1 Tax=Zootermopsis nevadensis TaxID=136037 RepID=A0A067QUI7_ZOONE|nr:hypothetical protein L798_00669 [Zootermopsis nevadensis]
MLGCLLPGRPSRGGGIEEVQDSGRETTGRDRVGRTRLPVSTQPLEEVHASLHHE